MRRTFILLAILLLAIFLRGLAVTRLPLDFDEPVYFRAGQRLAAAARAGDLSRFVNADSAPEHPGLVKLLYAAVFLTFPPAPEVPEYQADLSPAAYAPYAAQIAAMGGAARLASAAFGVLNVLLVALVSPAAGALLAVHTYTVKYTSQIYLEALPMFTATVAVLAYGRALAGQGSRGDLFSRAPLLPLSPSPPLLWLALSAVALGLTAAGKYVYAVAGLAIAADCLWRWAAWRVGANGTEGNRDGEQGRRGNDSGSPAPLPPLSPASLIAWGALALLVFFAANPYLWPDPVGRLVESVIFHAAYSQGAHVAQSGYPWWQPLAWLFTAQPARWHPGVLITPLDGLTAALGVVGVAAVWTADGGQRRVVVLWWAIGLVFLLLWTTKWPQYSLIMTVPMCLCAAEGLRQMVAWARRMTVGE